MLRLHAGTEANLGERAYHYEHHRPELAFLYPLIEEYYPVSSPSMPPSARHCLNLSSGGSNAIQTVDRGTSWWLRVDIVSPELRSIGLNQTVSEQLTPLRLQKPNRYQALEGRCASMDITASVGSDAKPVIGEDD